MKRLSALLVLTIIVFSCAPTVPKKKAGLPSSKPAVSVWSNAYVLKDQTPVRKKPAKGAALVTTLSDGDEVRIVDNRNGWYRIVTDNGRSGWVRSNLVGPRTLSRTAMASAFNDSIMTHFTAKLYIDKNHPYRVIYLETNEHNIAKAKKMARIVGKAYQQKVYAGKVTVNLIHPKQKKYFAQVILKAKGPARIPVPVIEYGYLEKIKVKGKAVRLIVRVPPSLSKKQLLKLARKISSAYSYPFTKSEIIIRPFPKGRINKNCLLYYVEDEYGEDYAFGRCRL